MGIPIGELQQRVSSREFVEYFAFDQLEPFGPERDDLRTGIVASTVANAARDRKRHPQAFQPADFMPRFGKGAEEEEPDQADLSERINAAMAAMGGQDPRESVTSADAPSASSPGSPAAGRQADVDEGRPSSGDRSEP